MASSPYHHGNARPALISAGKALLESAGATGLSLRAVAEAAGLSRQAPYNHFPDKQALLAAIVGDGFNAMSAQMDAASTRTRTTETALAAVAGAYVHFAIANPALFRLMFSSELVNLAAYPEAEAACHAAYARCTTAVAAITAPARAGDLATLTWALVHGYATLMIELGIEPPGAVAKRAKTIARMVIAAARDTEA